MDLNEIERKASQSESGVTELSAAVKQLQARVDRQAIFLQVLKDMLLAGDEAAEADFLDRLAKAVAQKVDGKTCKKCGKAINTKQARCMYCGEPRPPELL